MSCNVNYKGSQIASVGANQTKTLLTAGKYCEDDFKLLDTSNPVAEENDVIFIDYDGTIRYSYSAEEFLALTALPPNPVHEGLTAQGWNWTLADAKEYVGKYGIHVIGQNYDTFDGKTRFYFFMPNDAIQRTVTFHLKVSSGGQGIIDWGDGQTSIVSGTSYTDYSHTYNYSVNNFVIRVYAQSGTVTMGLYQYPILDGDGAMYCYKAELGTGVSYDDVAYGFFGKCQGMRTISIPTSYRCYWNTLRECRSLICAVLPDGWNGTTSVEFLDCYSLSALSLPKSSVRCGYYIFNCKNLAIPERNGPIESIVRGYCILTIIIPDGTTAVATLASNSFCHFLKFYPTTPPTISSSDAFYNFYAQCVYIVPYAGLAAYLSATNYPSPVTKTYLGFAKYNSGVTLPIQDSTSAYNVVWYATTADAIAQTNAISTGNGKEIYCRYTAA